MDLGEFMLLNGGGNEEEPKEGMIKKRALLAACDDFLRLVGLDPGPARVAACEALRDFVYIAMEHDEENSDNEY